MKLYLLVTLNALTVASLYFLVASGFSLIFGLLRLVNMAHGALFLVGGYVGYDVASRTGSWLFGLIAAMLASGLIGVFLHRFLLQPVKDNDLRQALVSIGFAVILSDLMLAYYGGATLQFSPPEIIYGSTPMMIIGAYPTIRLFVMATAIVVGIALWYLISRTRLGSLIRAGVDDREILGTVGVDVPKIMSRVFILGAVLAGFAGVVGGSALSIAPGEDMRYLLSSLVVVIVGGMGSLTGAALGALLIGFAEQFGMAFFPNYAMLSTFLIMVIVLAVRPHGLFGRKI